MKEKHWILLFFVVLAAHITAMQLQHSVLQLIFKPLIVITLIGYLDTQVSQTTKKLTNWVFAALFFSVAGDTLLFFQDRESMFFLLGLSAFLIAHICYIVFFEQVRRKEGIKFKALLPVIAAVYYAVLIYLLLPHLGEMKIPVLVYGIIISAMFMLAMHMLFIKNKTAGQLMMLGALLFVISDSVLAINKFYRPFAAANIIIMLTYGLAQFFIVKGVLDYLGRKDKVDIKIEPHRL